MTDFVSMQQLIPLVLAQAEKGKAAPAAGGGGWGEGIFGSMMFPLAITMVLMYFLLMRPEQRKRKETEKQLRELKKNDHVVTSGGIIGTVVVANEGQKSITLRIDDGNGTKIRVLRSAIVHVGPIDEAEPDAKKGD